MISDLAEVVILIERSVPGGVGTVTVAMFTKNAIAAHAMQLAAGWLG
jgi:5,10-methylene-tetrahydrofolate dehydrogenase/methenyl tetrahydrofolate cyclohydrolase